MIKKMMLEFEEVEYARIIKLKGDKTWIQLFNEGLNLIEQNQKVL